MKDDLGLTGVRGRPAEIWCEVLAVDHVDDGTALPVTTGRARAA
ncbi:hypothetical protein [Streptomyces sp. NPDC059564]